MSNFAALIATIQANIKTNGNEEITGAVLQDILEAMVDALGTEAINNLESALSDEETARQNADGTLQDNIDAETLRAGTEEAGLDNRLDTIEGEIPSAASSSNKLADKAYVDEADTALGNAIGAIEDATENGYVYAGIATPSGTPASGKVFYLAVTAGTYTNYGALVVTQGINILKNNGTAWSQEQLIALDNTPTPSSSGLVKSGGVDFLCSIKSNTSDIGILHELQSSFWHKNANNIIYRNTDYPQTKSANVIAVSEGDVINIKCQGFGSVSSYYISNDNLEVIVDSESGEAVSEGNIIIPVGGAYLFLNSRADGEIKAVKEGSVIDTMTKKLDSLRAQKPSLFVSTGNVSDELITNAYKFIKDIQITPPDGYNNVYLLYILKNYVLGGITYYSINLRYHKDDNVSDIDVSYPLGLPITGVNRYQVSQANTSIDVIVDWDSIADGIYTYGCKFNDFYLKEHISDLSYYKVKNYADAKIAESEEIKQPNIFNIASNVTDTEKQRAYGFIKDIQIVSISDSAYKYAYLAYFLKNADIGGTVYYSINLFIYDDNNNYIGFIFSIKQGIYTGIRYYETFSIISGVTARIKVVVDWDYLADGNYPFTSKGLQINDYYFKEHAGAIMEFANQKSISDMQTQYGGYISDQESNLLRADQLFIHNGEVVCTNGNRNNSDVFAKYAKVDLGATTKKVMCKFKLNKGGGGVVCLCTMNNNTNSPVDDITVGSVHVIVSKSNYAYGLYVNYVWDRTTVDLSSPLNENTEYEFGFEFLANDVVRFYLPDGTTNDVTITGASTYNGRYVVLELYGSNYSETITYDFPRMTINAIYAEPTSGIRLKDNFKRQDGVLNTAPTGHVYRLFRNTTDSDTIYDA